MVKYWPNKQSLELNNSIVDLFYDIRKKFIYNLSNHTNHHLYIDILNSPYKKKLFIIIIKELEKLILDTVELNLSIKSLQELNYRIVCDFINNVSNIFIQNINSKKYNQYIEKKQKIESVYKNNYYYNLIAIEHHLLAENLFRYLFFGSSSIDGNIFMFNKLYTPYKHVQILFENFILQVSNLTINNLCGNFFSLPGAIDFLKKNNICNHSYISTRSIALFFNNLNWQNLIYMYISQPKSIYNARYQVWLVSNKGIITKYIYLSRLEDLNKMSKTKIALLFFLEFKDFLIPKIESFLNIITKYIIYIIINLFSNIIILAIRIIIYYIHR
uniref:Uncharacterized protein n=1 Tax=Cumathamnion serrulatum TaxID=1206573 RepID=A0A7U1G3T8_9FLOR|nr:hypothetical protein K4Y23_pgp142 [Cumathamnion serrulatum]QQY85280.1 hypothetical protein [Cumathamnion serrulatum]